MPRRGLVAFGLILALGAKAASACDVPDQGSAPLRRMVAKVKYLPQTEAYSERMALDQAVVQYLLLLDQPRRVEGRCHWIVEVRSGDRIWKRFLVPAEAGPAIELPAAPAK